MKRAKYIRIKTTDNTVVVLDICDIGMFKITSNPKSEYVNTRFAMHIYPHESDKCFSLSFDSNEELMKTYNTICDLLKVTDV